MLPRGILIGRSARCLGCSLSRRTALRFARSRPCMIMGVPLSSTMMLGTTGSAGPLTRARRRLLSPASANRNRQGESPARERHGHPQDVSIRTRVECESHISWRAPRLAYASRPGPNSARRNPCSFLRISLRLHPATGSYMPGTALSEAPACRYMARRGQSARKSKRHGQQVLQNRHLPCSVSNALAENALLALDRVCSFSSTSTG